MSATDYPALGRAHFNQARAFFDRSDMLLALRPEKGLVICEVGVGLGGFSRFLLDHMRPSSFVAIDQFDLHKEQNLWGHSPAQLFGGATHQAFYEQTFAYRSDIMTVLRGQSHECLAMQQEGAFDILYIDAGHDYDSVRRDAAAGVGKVKPDGLLVFNDYTLHDAGYGVVQAVNELIVASDWKVVGFSLQKQMYCDIALQRA